METQSNSANTVRIDETNLKRIREIAKANGQTIVGYINLKLGKIVERDWKKLHPNEDGFQQDKT
jgi:hypothetical protein